MTNLPKLIVILGPTASGKSKLTIKLARAFKGEIVSADSLQIYKDFDIGTAKVSTEEQKLVPHHLVDIREPTTEFTVAEYKKLALQTINNISQRKKIPCLVGGTGFYISSIVDNLEIPRVPPNQALREQLESGIKNHESGTAKLYKKLIKIDPAAAHFVEPHNPRRIIRALEVIKATGQKLSTLRTKGPRLFDILQLGLKLSDQQLAKNISHRVEQMFKQGLVNEVKKIIKRYGDVKPLEAIGYKEVANYLEQKTSLTEAKELIKLHTRQLAKRQMKWFKRDTTIKWVANFAQAENLIKNFLIQSS